MFTIGAIVPLIPYLLGFGSLWAGLLCGGIGLLVAGGLAARFTRRPIWFASLRQLAFGAVAIAATYAVGSSSIQFSREETAVQPVRGRFCVAACSPGAHVVDGLATTSGRSTFRPAPVRRHGGRRTFGDQLRPRPPGLYVISDDRSAKNPARFYTVRIMLPNNRLIGVEWLDTTRCWTDRRTVPAAVAEPRLGDTARSGGHRLRRAPSTAVLVQRG